jgi:hypothetical protein
VTVLPVPVGGNLKIVIVTSNIDMLREGFTNFFQDFQAQRRRKNWKETSTMIA